MKKTFTMLMLLGATVASFAQTKAKVGTVEYFLDEGEAIILEQPDTLSGDLVIPSTVSYNGVDYKVIGMNDEAFSGTKITSIILPSSMTVFGNKAFRNCEKLKSVTLPSGMTSIGDEYFEYCYDLASITLPEGVTSLGSSCFFSCYNLRTVEFSKNIQTLGNSCFSECRNLTFSELPNTITSIGDYCFYNCNNLTSVVLPNSITTIGKSAFDNCDALVSITLPNNISELEEYTFSSCPKLTGITIPNSVTSIGSHCFYSCSSLTSVTLSNSLQSLGSECFRDCAIESIDLPSTLQTLGSYCFYYCTKLLAVKLPYSLTKIGYGCFSYCNNLMKVTCVWDNLDALQTDNNIFNGIYSQAMLYVPNGTSEMYKAKEPWSGFTTIKENGGTAKPTEKCATPTIEYKDKQLVFNCSTEGAQYHYVITDDDMTIGSFTEVGTVGLSAAYNIRVYASAADHSNSDYAEAKLCFVDATLSDGIEAVESRGIVVANQGSNVSVSGLNDGEVVSLYSLSGVMLSTARANAGIANLSTVGENGFVILKIGQQSLKINLK